MTPATRPTGGAVEEGGTHNAPSNAPFLLTTSPAPKPSLLLARVLMAVPVPRRHGHPHAHPHYQAEQLVGERKVL
jgi:hypothetical protein